jgi:hypothetical protein
MRPKPEQYTANGGGNSCTARGKAERESGQGRLSNLARPLTSSRSLPGSARSFRRHGRLCRCRVTTCGVDFVGVIDGVIDGVVLFVFPRES